MIFISCSGYCFIIINALGLCGFKFIEIDYCWPNVNKDNFIKKILFDNKEWHIRRSE